MPDSEGWNPEWESRFDELYGYNPTKAKAAPEGGRLRPGQLKFKILAFTEPGESEGPQVAEALAIYYKTSASTTEIEMLDWAKVREMFRKKAIQCCIWPNIISLAALGGVDPDELLQQGPEPPLRERVHREDTTTR